MMHQQKSTSRPFKFITVVVLIFLPVILLAQVTRQDSLLTEVTLANAINYAIAHQPQIQQSLLDEQVTEYTIKSKLSEMYPQLNFNYILQHNFINQTTVIGGNLIRLGVGNTSAGQFTVNQAIFNKDVLLANRTRRDLRLQSALFTSTNKIDVAAEVAKAFYGLLSTMQQINISAENILRIERSLKDAYNQYKAGITDKTDYKRATITLNNTVASKKSSEVLLKAKKEYLKTLMGYPEAANLNIVYDTTHMENDFVLDTLAVPDYKARVEYRLLETRQRLLQYNVKYYRWGYLPTVSANGAYNLNYQNNDFAKVYSNNFPNSFAALTLGFPIFQGGRRKADIHVAELKLQRSQLDMVTLRNLVNSGYAQALATYKSNLYNYLALKDNLALAQEVYDVIQLQYRSGIKTYLEVITAETDLRTSQINFNNAMYQLLSSKVDVQKTLGQINY
ncbi:MAG: TolC family protein [Aquabacterium sp.]|nr:TolC family protein [Ferruginibacter sp.]